MPIAHCNLKTWTSIEICPSSTFITTWSLAVGFVLWKAFSSSHVVNEAPFQSPTGYELSVTVCDNNDTLSSEQGLSSFKPHPRSPHHCMVVLVDLRSWSEEENEDCGFMGILAQLSSTLTRSTREPQNHGAWWIPSRDFQSEIGYP
jgi:hypothetical protein